MRICLIIPSYAILSFLQIYFPAAYVYIDPWLDVVQAIALGSFFLLMCEFVSPNSEQRDVFFAALDVPDRKDPSKKVNGLPVFRVSSSEQNLVHQADSLVLRSVYGFSYFSTQSCHLLQPS